MDVSITLAIRQTLGVPRLELEGECENGKSSLALTRLFSAIIRLMRECDGILLPEMKEIPANKFYMAMIFPDDEKKKAFLERLPYVK